MNRDRACSILGVAKDSRPDEIKKKYRLLIRKAHPDARAFQPEKEACAYSAQELNAAYAYLCEHPYQTKKEARNTDADSQPDKSWNNWKAKENPNAYRKRKIFYELRDEADERLGEICVAEGKLDVIGKQT